MTPAALTKKAGLLLDTNLLVLYIVGTYDPTRITQNKRTNRYTADDFDLLMSFMSRFQNFITTPNILTEVSNLLEGVAYQYGPVLALLPALVKDFIEIHELSYPVMTIQNKVFIKFGLSDTVSYKLAEQNFLLLTDDLKLCYYCQNNGIEAVNFNNLRSDFLFSQILRFALPVNANYILCAQLLPGYFLCCSPD